jgi:hypothetical protein
MRNNPFSSYRPGVAALGGGGFDDDSKPQGSSTAGTEPRQPIEPTRPGGWEPEPGSGQKPPTSAVGGQPWKTDEGRAWFQKWFNRANGGRNYTTYGLNNDVLRQGTVTLSGFRRPDGSISYNGPQVRYGPNSLPPELVGNPNIWNPEWMERYNDYRDGYGPDPRTQGSLSTIPRSGMGPPAPGGG